MEYLFIGLAILAVAVFVILVLGTIGTRTRKMEPPTAHPEGRAEYQEHSLKRGADSARPASELRSPLGVKRVGTSPVRHRDRELEKQPPVGPEKRNESLDADTEQALDSEMLRYAEKSFGMDEANRPAYAEPVELPYSLQQVFFATDRCPLGDANEARFADSRCTDDQLRYGMAEVSIPKDHRIGRIERPHWYKFEFKEDPEKHIVILGSECLEQQQFFNRVKEIVCISPKREAFVFVHGYNVSFDEALRRTAQFSYDLEFSGAAILYSWPSKGATLDYFADEASADYTVRHLRDFLTAVAYKAGALTVHLIAHSMGNRALVRAIEHLDLPKERRFGELVMAAPDMDAGEFRHIADSLAKASTRATLYGSAEDKALLLSKSLHQFPRAGDGGALIVLTDGVDSIDASTVDTSLLAHSYYGDERTVISDLYYLIHDRKPPRERHGLEERRRKEKVYWAFRL